MKTLTLKPKKLSSASRITGVDDKTLDRLVSVFKSLADKHRLMILVLLARAGKLHVSKICDELGQSQPAVSHHLTQLKNSGLVSSDREGKFNFYQLDSAQVFEILAKFYPAGGAQSLTFGELELAIRPR